MTADEIDSLWLATLKYADPTAGNAHILFARALLAQPKQPASLSLQWCNGCGEGYVDFCWGNNATCPMKPIAHKEQSAAKLLQIIAHAYQIAGACDVPTHILDVLANPEKATQEQIDAMLPFAQPATEQNFCPRCGKRIGGVDDVHTCTAPAHLNLSKKTIEKLHKFLDAAAGDGVIIDGVDAADLYIEIFPEQYAESAK